MNVINTSIKRLSAMWNVKFHLPTENSKFYLQSKLELLSYKENNWRASSSFQMNTLGCEYDNFLPTFRITNFANWHSNISTWKLTRLFSSDAHWHDLRRIWGISVRSNKMLWNKADKIIWKKSKSQICLKIFSFFRWLSRRCNKVDKFMN